MIDISKALSISDYQSNERTAELTWLAQQASRHTAILEVGSWKGCTARAMADNTKGALACVDSWDGGDNWEFKKEIAEHNPDWAFQEFQRNMAGLSNYHTYRRPSLDAAAMFKLLGFKYDMIFIDASHDYDSVKKDILAWLPFLAPGGLFCGHDRSWDGVAKAVSELLPNAGVGAGAIWAC